MSVIPEKLTWVTQIRNCRVRTKSMRDIKQQYSRIKNRLYRQYLDYQIDENTYNSRQKALDRTYDRYERNIARQQGKPAQRGISNYNGMIDHNIQYSQKAYAGSKG